MARANVIQVLINGKDNTSPAFRQATQSAQVFAAAVTAAFGAATIAAVQFESRMAEISTLLDGDVAPAMERISSGVRSMSKEFGESTNALARANYDIISSGMTDAADSAMVLEAAVKLGTATFTDAAVGADVLTTVLNAYGDSADQAGRRANTLWQIIQKGKTTGQQLFPVLGRVASLAAAAGIEFEELAAAIAAITAAGVQTDEAITSLRSLISALVTPTEEAKQIFEEFGIDLEQGGLIDSLEKLGRVGEQGMNRIATAIPNIRALTGVLATDIDRVNDALDTMNTNATSLETAFEKVQATTQKQFDRLKATLIDIGVALGQQLIPIFQQLLDVLQDVADWFTNLSEENQQLIVRLGLLVIAVGGVATAMTTFLAVAAKVAVVLGAATGPAGWITLAVIGLGSLAIAMKNAQDAAENLRSAAAQEYIDSTTLDNVVQRLRDAEVAAEKAQQALDAFDAPGGRGETLNAAMRPRERAMLIEDVRRTNEELEGMRERMTQLLGDQSFWEVRLPGVTNYTAATEDANEATQEAIDWQERAEALQRRLTLAAEVRSAARRRAIALAREQAEAEEQLLEVNTRQLQVQQARQAQMTDEAEQQELLTEGLVRMANVGANAILQMSNAFANSVAQSILQGMRFEVERMTQSWPSWARAAVKALQAVLRVVIQLIVQLTVAAALLSLVGIGTFGGNFVAGLRGVLGAGGAGRGAASAVTTLGGGATSFVGDAPATAGAGTVIVQMAVDTLTPFSAQELRTVGEEVGRGVVIASEYNFGGIQ